MHMKSPTPKMRNRKPLQRPWRRELHAKVAKSSQLLHLNRQIQMFHSHLNPAVRIHNLCKSLEPQNSSSQGLSNGMLTSTYTPTKVAFTVSTLVLTTRS